ncbi:META domain-containing protein [Altericroceibacterium spongiae]|uniref:META domain-containing protein n=1 Tax=Altericroceibacterium spongiae TaxID=2320269 RepID=A0A420EMN4_9SPHN|nr:META domain-containing protein [Altericroceibacterium spongiae]RKF21913.1 META domain-containing protein [Altericroceibacterium spongiae]
MPRALPAFLLLCLAGCAIRPTADHQLADSEWRLTTLDGAAPAGNKPASLSFKGSEVQASIGCNRMRGAWHVEEQRLLAGPFRQTTVECRDIGLFEQEQALQSLLVAGPKMDLEGDRLTLRSSGHQALLQKISPRQ